MRRWLSPLIALWLAAHPGFARAQVAEAGTFATIAQIRQGLNETVVGVKNATATAGAEAKTLGTSLQANLQNVISDIDARFANRLDVTVETLVGAERQFATDARNLILRGRAAAEALAATPGDESRRTIGEADIAAYDASASLPCRTQAPRIAYWTPTRATAKGEEVLVSIHGNFLNFGTDLSVTIDGVASRPITRTDRAITVKIPSDVVQKITQPSSLKIVLSGLQTRVIEPRPLTMFFGCREEFSRAEDSSIAVQVVPRLHYRIKSEVWATYREWSPEFIHVRDRFNRNVDTCDHDEDVSFSACVPAENMRAVRGQYKVNGKSGPSEFGPATQSGASCVQFGGRLKGSGYEHTAGNKNCRGSAWLDVDWEVVAQRLDVKETDRKVSEDTLPIGQNAHAVNHTITPVGEDWRWRYLVTIDQMRGSQVQASETLTDGRPDNGKGWASTIKDGLLSITLPSEDK
jgi:hypothetical protein